VSAPSPDLAAQAPAADRPPKVVYVMGAGRSGSTILGTTLGNCTDIFFAGELARWHRRAGEPLAGAERERFWRAVREEVEIDVDSLGPEVRCLQQSSGLFRVGSWRAQRRLRPRFRSASEDLYRAIARTAAVRYVVDSSHFPRRARELQSLPGIELYLLFLVRDAQGVVASYNRRDVVQGPKFNTLATNAYLWLTYLLSLFVFLRQPRERRLFVRHDAFVADPERVLREILDGIGSSAGIPDLGALRTDRAFLGNRMVKSSVVALERKPTAPPKRSRVTTLLQLPWRAVFSLLRPRVTGAR
jgi:hypothetical protein